MISCIGAITIDCRDPVALSGFWGTVLGYSVHPESSSAEALLLPPDAGAAEISFVPVPEDKQVKNRLHFDLIPQATQETEVDRLVGVGASIVDDRRASDGWVVMADPEGNEFCVMQSEDERDG